MNALLLSLVTFFSTSAGGLCAFRFRDRLHLLLGFTAGVLLGVVAFDLLPEVFELSHRLGSDGQPAMVALAGGFLLFHSLEKFVLVHRVHEAEYAHHHHPSVGMLSARENQMDRATQHLQRAIDLRPEYADALNNLGVLFVRQRRYSEAKERFEACIRVAPNFDQGYLNLARLYVLLSDKPRARGVLRALLQKQPKHKVAQQALEMLD